MQTSLVVAISALVGLASAGLVWFGTGLTQRLQVSIAEWQQARQAKAAAKAAEASTPEPPKEAGGARK